MPSAGVEITWVPIWLADVWRVGLWVAMVLIVGKYLSLIPERRRVWRRSAVYGSTALLVFIAIAAIQTAERFGDYLSLEITPAFTVATVLSYLSLRELTDVTTTETAERRF